MGRGIDENKPVVFFGQPALRLGGGRGGDDGGGGGDGGHVVLPLPPKPLDLRLRVAEIVGELGHLLLQRA